MIHSLKTNLIKRETNSLRERNIYNLMGRGREIRKKMKERNYIIYTYINSAHKIIRLIARDVKVDRL